MDANGILNVTAVESGTGKSRNITIKNDKGRLSKTEIEKMLEEAERYKEEDNMQRDKVASRNKLEGYVFRFVLNHGVDKYKVTLITNEIKTIF